MTLFLELCGCRGCTKPRRREEIADPWPPSSASYSRKQHISHPQREVFPRVRHAQNPLKNSATDCWSLLNLTQACFTFHVYMVTGKALPCSCPHLLPLWWTFFNCTTFDPLFGSVLGLHGSSAPNTTYVMFFGGLQLFDSKATQNVKNIYKTFFIWHLWPLS